MQSARVSNDEPGNNVYFSLSFKLELAILTVYSVY